MRDYATLKSHLLWDLAPELPADDFFTSDMSVKSAMARALADSFYKKLCPLGNTQVADDNALKKFKTINARIPTSPFEFPAINEAESCFFDYFIDNLNRTLGFDAGDVNYDLDFIRENMGVGPGAAQKADATHMVSKLFEGPISYTTSEHLIPLYRSAVSDMGLWADAEHLRSSKFPFEHVEGGKLFFAPKNAEISRTCCTEANLNMLIQKSLGAFMEARLAKHYGISLSTQPSYNRELARIGSENGRFATIDLVSASDSISWQLVLRTLEDGFTKAVLRMSRSESAVLPDGSKVVLNMISTMGNGFTFPLQTVIFASAVRACYQLMGYPCRCPKTEFGVFGDDLIVRRETYDFVCRMLNKLGFEVNEGKSFNNGPFRESCGHDYFRGVNIRGVYIKSIESPQQIYSCINRLIRWSTDSGIPLVRTLNWLRSQLGRKVYLVPRSESDDAGLKVPFKCTLPKVDSRYWYSYRYYKRQPNKLSIPEADLTPNPYGTGVGFLSGHIRRRDLSITVTTKRDHPFGVSLGELYNSNPWRQGYLSTIRDWSADISTRDRPGVKSRYKISKNSIPWWDFPGFSNESKIDPSRPTTWSPGREVRSEDAWERALMATFTF